MKRIEEWLKKHPLIGLDTPIFIYHLEDHPRYAPLTDALFDSKVFKFLTINHLEG